MLDSQGEETRDAAERPDRSSEGAREKNIVVQPLCDCSSSSSSFVVFTCPKCMGVALRALEEVFRGEKGFF